MSADETGGAVGGGEAASGDAAKGGEPSAAAAGVGEDTQPGLKVPEGVTSAPLAEKLEPDAPIDDVKESKLNVSAIAPLPGDPPFDPNKESVTDFGSTAPIDTVPLPEAESLEPAKATLVSTPAESGDGVAAGSQVSVSGGASDGAGLPGEGHEPSAGVADGAAASTTGAAAAPAVPNSPARESEAAATASPPAPEAAKPPAPPEVPPAEEPAPEIPEFLKKATAGPGPDPMPPPTRTGFNQLAPAPFPNDFELVKVWRANDPTRWFWAKQAETFAAATLVWERRAFMRSQYPEVEVLTSDELQLLA